MADPEQYIAAHYDETIAELSEFLAIPSISALPEHANDMLRSAAWTAAAMQAAGLEHVRIIETRGHPLVYGDWLHAGDALTLLCYGHYDVQPADPLEEWDSPPFVPTVRGGKLYARGATDDKGQLFIHVKAIQTLLRCRGGLPVNVKVLIEGEEEIGGGNLELFVVQHADMLAADVVVNSDNAMFSADVPSLTYAMRGLVCVEIELSTACADQHSGTFGGAVRNAAAELAQLLAQLKDRAGRVAIPDFYSSVRALTPEERAELAQLPFDEAAYRAHLGVTLHGEAGFTTLERMWVRPALEVNGLCAGYTGPGIKTVIPSRASATLSIRTVPDQNAESVRSALTQFLEAMTPESVAIRVTALQDGAAWSEPLDTPVMRAAELAIGHGFGKPPVFIREGGSNPIMPLFQSTLRARTLLFGIGLPDEHAHAPNEHLTLWNFRRGISAAVRLYDEIGRASKVQ
jgi:acetylornithine deacetylase/succinyl-diaminopimelate desuccinylase-like protein